MRCAFPSLCALRCANKFPSVTMVLALVLTLFDKRDPTGALTDRPSHLISSHLILSAELLELRVPERRFEA